MKKLPLTVAAIGIFAFAGSAGATNPGGEQVNGCVGGRVTNNVAGAVNNGTAPGNTEVSLGDWVTQAQNEDGQGRGDARVNQIQKRCGNAQNAQPGGPGEPTICFSSLPPGARPCRSRRSGETTE